MKYERLTTRNNWLGIVLNKKAITLQGLLDSLAKLEDKIESGELISTVQAEQGEQEIAFFVEHNAEVRKQAIKEIEAAEDEVAKETEEILFIDVYNRLHEKGDYMGCVIVAEMAKERGVLWEEQE